MYVTATERISFHRQRLNHSETEIVTDLVDKKVFTRIPGREGYPSFPDFVINLLDGLNYQDLHTWMIGLLDKWALRTCENINLSTLLRGNFINYLTGVLSLYCFFIYVGKVATRDVVYYIRLYHGLYIYFNYINRNHLIYHNCLYSQKVKYSH